MDKKIVIGTLAFLTFLSIGSNIAYAHGTSTSFDEIKNARKSGDFGEMENRMNKMMGRMSRDFDINDAQREELMQLHKSGDMDSVHEKMLELGIEPRFPEKFSQLTEDQKIQLKNLRENGDKEALFEKMHEFGMDFDKQKLTDEQRKELKDLHSNGDMEKLMEKRQDFGLKMPNNMEAFSEKHADDKMDMMGENSFNKGPGSRGFFGMIGGFFSGMFK